MPQIRKILCPTDWSGPSRVALQTAVNLARFEGAELLLLHVLPPLGMVRGIASVVPLGEAIKQDAARQQAALIKELVPSDVKVTPLIRVGDEAEEILKCACECDVVVISTHGRAGWARWAFGSVAQTVLRETACPIFAIGPTGAPSANEKAQGNGCFSCVDFPFKQVLWLTDWSLPAERALDEAIAVSQRHDAQLLLLHVLEPPVPPDLEPLVWEDEQRALAEVCFRELCERHPGAKSARRLVCRGVAATEIARVAVSEGADLIVMNTHGRTCWKQLTLGSVAQKVLRLVPCPVFLVPPGAASSPPTEAQSEAASNT